MRRQIIGGIICAGLLAGAAWAGRHEEYTARYRTTPDQARVVSAGYLGGRGTEWLCGGGFQQDGSIIAVGTALGPTVTIAGQDARLLGIDTEEPVEVKIEVDNQGRPRPFAWTHENATAFLAKLSPDAKTVQAVARFPWKVAGATSAVVDGAGDIYVTGPATPAVAQLCADSQTWPVDVEAIKAVGLATRTIYLAKVAGDLSKVLWVRTLTGPSAAPILTLCQDGTLRLQGPDLRNISPQGAVLSVTVVPGGLGPTTAVNPVDGTFVFGGEHHWPTDREPWRCPILNVYAPDGKERYHLYDWGGPFVGLGEQRLVSDTAIRNVAYDRAGNLLITAWSDGGNSVIYREPMDVYQYANFKGLGFSGWGGGGAKSYAYVVKIDTQSYRVKCGTLWASFRLDQDRPNSATITTLGFAADGAICVGGATAMGLIQTGNNILTTCPPDKPGDPARPGQPGGPYVAVFREDLSSIRFSSTMPACAATDLNNGDTWAFATGTVAGKPMLLALTGAQAQDSSYNMGALAPTINPAQAQYAGGFTDGHLLVLDLSGE